MPLWFERPLSLASPPASFLLFTISRSIASNFSAPHHFSPSSSIVLWSCARRCPSWFARPLPLASAPTSFHLLLTIPTSVGSTFSAPHYFSPSTTARTKQGTLINPLISQPELAPHAQWEARSLNTARFLQHHPRSHPALASRVGDDKQPARCPSPSTPPSFPMQRMLPMRGGEQVAHTPPLSFNFRLRFFCHSRNQQRDTSTATLPREFEHKRVNDS
ncbi:hypothetical protein BCR34DRAFT_595092 [Clohesyomyces aquaticus]|uniref:Uncharacterized protein n=1 Tax=Clohesyomyces aquaticus TaxID=1231657 RepID=A0A1Y1XWT9_9PLEO|nr:hypothetical protein BCR34DRAFT_595092 [Clohesyomyces aquaticus]